MSTSHASMSILITASVTAAEWGLPWCPPSPRIREAPQISVKPDGKFSSGAERTENHIGSMLSPLGKRSTCTRPTWIRRCPYRLDETVRLLAHRALSFLCPLPAHTAPAPHFPKAQRRSSFCHDQSPQYPWSRVFSLKARHPLVLTDH